MPTTLTTLLLVLTVILVLSPTGSYAFGAGDIPDFAYLNGGALLLTKARETADAPIPRQGVQAWRY